MEDNEKKAPELKDPERPHQDWSTGGCPFLFFGDDDAAEYDLDKIRGFFKRFKKSKQK